MMLISELVKFGSKTQPMSLWRRNETFKLLKIIRHRKGSAWFTVDLILKIMWTTFPSLNSDALFRSAEDCGTFTVIVRSSTDVNIRSKPPNKNLTSSSNISTLIFWQSGGIHKYFWTSCLKVSVWHVKIDNLIDQIDWNTVAIACLHHWCYWKSSIWCFDVCYISALEMKRARLLSFSRPTSYFSESGGACRLNLTI